MKMPCHVIEDLLPLYTEEMVAEKTKKLIQDHLETCTCCKKKYDDLKDNKGLKAYEWDIHPLAKIRKKLKQKRRKTILFSCVFTLILALLFFVHGLRPIPIQAEKEAFASFVREDGTIEIIIQEPISGWDLDYSLEDGARVYYLSAWTDRLSRFRKSTFSKERVQIPVTKESVFGVYYTPNNGEENMLIFGKSITPNGGSVTLPRLALNYYVGLSLGLVLFGALAVGLNWKRLRRRRILLNIFLMPLSYLGAHFLVKGFRGHTYFMLYDWYGILLLTALLYGLCLILVRFVREKSLSWEI